LCTKLGGGAKPREGGAAEHPLFIYSGSLTDVYPRDSEIELVTSDVTPTVSDLYGFFPVLVLRGLLRLTEHVEVAISAFDSAVQGLEFLSVVCLCSL
jgi:hypothetical protein